MHNPIIDLFVKCQSGNKAKWLLKQEPIKTSSKFKRFIELRQTDTTTETIGDNLDHRDWSHWWRGEVGHPWLIHESCTKYMWLLTCSVWEGYLGGTGLFYGGCTVVAGWAAQWGHSSATWGTLGSEMCLTQPRLEIGGKKPKSMALLVLIKAECIWYLILTWHDIK